MILRRCQLKRVAGILVALLAACHSAPTRLYMVEPITPTATADDYNGPPVQVEAVHIPAALDRMEIVSEVAPGEFKISELDRWMAPLGQGIRQALTADLAARLPQGRVIFPHLAKAPRTLSIRVELLEFNADRQGAKLLVSWLGTSEGAQPRSLGGTMVLQTSLSGAGSGSIATALSKLIAQLADRIVAELLLPAPGDASTSAGS
jgi:uncharacterized lipoprotein YmbA